MRDVRVPDRDSARRSGGPGAIGGCWFSKIPPGPERVSGGESFIRARDPAGARVPEDARFAGPR
jgi:hypothetical protein